MIEFPPAAGGEMLMEAGMDDMPMDLIILHQHNILNHTLSAGWLWEGRALKRVLKRGPIGGGHDSLTKNLRCSEHEAKVGASVRFNLSDWA
jgi:hypothetical protein